MLAGMDDDRLDRQDQTPSADQLASPAGRDERPTRPDDQLPRPELTAEDVGRMATDEPAPAPRGDIPNADHPQQLPDGNYVGEDNIREGNVGGVMGGPHQQGGHGQGG